MRQQNWLNDTYQASKTRPPMTAPNPMPPSMIPGARTPGVSMPSLGYGGAAGPKPFGGPALGGPLTAAPSPTAPTPSPAMTPTPLPSLTAGAPAAAGGVNMDDLLAALRASHPAAGGGSAGAPQTDYAFPGARTPTVNPHGGLPGVTPGGPTTAPIGPPPQPPTVVPPASTAPNPPGPGTPGYQGPGGITGAAYRSPQDALAQIRADIANNPAGWKQYGLFNSTGAGAADLSWLQYILSDPYNRMITDSAEKQTLENTNTAFDAAREKMRSDALQSGAAEGGVAKGGASALSLAKGATQAKNVRDFEQYKVDTGDKRLESMGLPLLSLYNSAKTGNPVNNTQGADKTQQYLQYASLIASLFA